MLPIGLDENLWEVDALPCYRRCADDVTGTGSHSGGQVLQNLISSSRKGLFFYLNVMLIST